MWWRGKEAATTRCAVAEETSVTTIPPFEFLTVTLADFVCWPHACAVAAGVVALLLLHGMCNVQAVR